MNIHVFFLLYAISVPLFVLGDLLWLGVVAKQFYHARLGHLMGEVQWVAVALFYFVFMLGLTYFATYPSITKGTVLTAVVLGGLFGFFTYATYDFTNWATLRNWSGLVTLVDIIWGTLLCSGVAAATVYIAERII